MTRCNRKFGQFQKVCCIRMEATGGCTGRVGRVWAASTSPSGQQTVWEAMGSAVASWC